MLRAHALADLFTENLDDTTSAIFLTTPAGNLVGSSDPAPPRKAHVLCALTWRHYRAPPPPSASSSSGAISSGTSSDHHGGGSRNGGASSDASATRGGDAATEAAAAAAAAEAARPLRVQPLTVLRQARHEEGALRTLAVEIDGRECVLEDLMDGLVLGVLAPDRREAGGEDGFGETNGNGEADNDEEARSSDDPASKSDRASTSTEDEEKEKARRIHVLTLKVQALAEYLREELQDFKMPPELH